MDAPLLAKVGEAWCRRPLAPARAELLLAVSRRAGFYGVVYASSLTAFAPAQQLQCAWRTCNTGCARRRRRRRAVAEWAARCGLQFLRRDVDVPARVAARGESLEEAARNLRYQALEEMAREARCEAIVTGHTADDQAETVLMHILRGAGAGGLAGMPARHGNIVRPLLSLWRHEIMTYLQRHALPYRLDASNADTTLTRNRVRLDLLPRLEAEYAAGLRARLLQLAALARQDHEALEMLAEDLYSRVVERLPEGVALRLDASLPPALASRVWRRGNG